MTVPSAIAIYFVIWWIVLFAVLPWGIRTQQEDGVVVPGTEPSAPTRMRFLKIIVANSIVAAIVFLLFLGMIHSGVTFDDIPFVRDL